MDDFDKIRAQVSRRLQCEYPGDPDDGEGANDRIWINKNQKHEVDYAIAKCLCDCNASKLAKSTTVIQRLEQKIKSMDHDGQGRCERVKAYEELKELINSKKSSWLLAISIGIME